MSTEKSDVGLTFQSQEVEQGVSKLPEISEEKKEIESSNLTIAQLRSERKKQKALRREKRKGGMPGNEVTRLQDPSNGVKDIQTNSTPQNSTTTHKQGKNLVDSKDLNKVTITVESLPSSSSSSSSQPTLPNKNVGTLSLAPRSQYTPQNMMHDDAKSQKKIASKLAKQQVPKRQETKRKMAMFSHLVQMERNFNFGAYISFSSKIHPGFITFGLQCADGIVFDQNQRCIRLIECLKMFVMDYVTPPSKELSRDMESRLSPSLSFLTQCRPLSAGMSTIIKFFKVKIFDVFSLPEQSAKKELDKFLDNFFYERVLFAGEAIINGTKSRIVDNDVILTFSNSTLILNAIIGAANDGKMFKVIVVDTKPRFDGRKALRILSDNGIKCTYINISALCYVMNDVTKVFIASSALLANGAVMCPVGSAMVAIVALSHNVPFLVCCETFKFIERAQTDAFVYNELGDPDDLITSTSWCPHMITDWKELPNISLLNIYHDIIQPSFVTAVITELGTIPCSSAPVVLRVKN